MNNFNDTIEFSIHNTYVQAKQAARKFRENNRNIHVKIFIDGFTHCDSMGNPLNSEFYVQIKRKGGNKLIDLPF